MRRKSQGGNDRDRREFLKGSGALIVSFSFAPASAFAAAGGHAVEELDSWLAIRPRQRDAYTGKCEIGQGLFTAQTQLIAEELAVPVARSSSSRA